MDQKKPPQPRVVTKDVEGLDKTSGADGMLKHMFSIGPQIAAEFNRQNMAEAPPEDNTIGQQHQPAVTKAFDGRPITARVLGNAPRNLAPNTTSTGPNVNNNGHGHPMELLPAGHDGLSQHSRVYVNNGEQPVVGPQQQMSSRYAEQVQTQNPNMITNAPPPANRQNQKVVTSNTPDPVRIPGMLNLVPNHAMTLESTLADSDSNYMELPTPPSRCHFYSWKRLSIRRLRTPEIRKAFQAAQTESFRHFAQILASTLDRPYQELTIYDFWWCMYYHQQNSYPKAPATITYMCSSPAHFKMIKEGQASKESVTQKAQVRRQEFEEITISNENNDLAGELMKATMEELGIVLYPPTVMDAIEMTEEKDLLDERSMINHLANAVKNNPTDVEAAVQLQKARAEYQDLIWINDMASWLHPTHGRSIAERREFLESDLIDIQIFDRIEEFQKLVQHGIVETITTTCQVCAGESVIPVTLSPAHFLPELQRAKFARNADAG